MEVLDSLKATLDDAAAREERGEAVDVEAVRKAATVANSLPRRKAGVVFLVGRAHQILGRCLRGQDPEGALLAFGRALDAFLALDPRSAAVSATLNSIGLTHHAVAHDHDAIRAFDRALEIDEATAPGSEAVAATRNNRGLARAALGDVGGARMDLEAAEGIMAEKSPYSAQRAAVEDDLAELRLASGEPKGALESLFIAIQIRIEETDFGTLRATLRRFCQIALAMPNATEYASQLETMAEEIQGGAGPAYAALIWAEAADLRAAVAPSERATGLAFERVAQDLRRFGNEGEALKAGQRALAVFEGIDPASRDTAISLTNVGMAEASLGDLINSREHLVAAREILLAIPDANSLPMAHVLDGLGRIAHAEGNEEVAAMWFRQALAIVEAASPNSWDHAYVLDDLGMSMLSVGDTNAADTFDRAASIYAQVLPDSDLRVTAMASAAVARLRSGRVAEAIELARQAEQLSRELNLAPGVRAGTLQALSSAQIEAGELGEAANTALQVVNLLRSANVTDDRLLAALNSAGQIRLMTGDYDGAIEMLAPAEELADSLRPRAGTAGHRAATFESMLAPSQGLVQAYVARGGPADTEAAFAVVERSRANDLVDLIGARSENETVMAPELAELSIRERDLERDIARRYAAMVEDIRHPESVVRAIAASPDPRRAAAENAQWITGRAMLEQELETTRSRMRRIDPRHEPDTAMPSSTLADAQEDLPDDTVLIEFAFARDGLYRWLVSRRGNRVSRRDDGAKVIPALRDALAPFTPAGGRDLRTSGLASGGVAQQREAIATLSALLLGDVPEDWFADIRNLRIVADGPLQLLPFEILEFPGHDGDLAATFSVSYGPSSTVLRALRERWRGRPQPDKDFIGFGDVPASSGAIDPTASGVIPGGDRDWIVTALPGSRAELEKAAAWFEPASAIWVGTAATEWRALTETKGYRFVHFATHGLVTDGDGLYGGLLLAPPDGSEPAGSDCDAFLQIFEMRWMTLDAELVVCSACRTGLGELVDGEGVRGMDYALFAAGARAVIISLWSVPDQATAVLMTSFYQRVREGSTIAAALADAKREVRGTERWKDPYHWAAFVLIGPGDVPVLTKG